MNLTLRSEGAKTECVCCEGIHFMNCSFSDEQVNCPYKEGNVRIKEYSCDQERPAARPTELQKNEKQNKNT